MRLFRTLALLPVIGLVACHSKYVDATLSNRSSQKIGLIEVSYPSASFGTQSLAPGADFHYRFKVLGEGNLKVTYTDASNNEKKAEGFSLNESSEGPITITVADDGVHWLNSTIRK